MQDSKFIGLDVHKATISVAVSQGEREIGEVARADFLQIGLELRERLLARTEI